MKMNQPPAFIFRKEDEESNKLKLFSCSLFLFVRNDLKRLEALISEGLETYLIHYYTKGSY